jgi:hypothetical protein
MKLILDTFCEVYDLLVAHADGEFWDFNQHEVIPGAVYLFGRQQFQEHKDRIVALTLAGTIRPIISNPHEGSDTLRRHCNVWGVVDLIRQHKILVIGGGAMDNSWPCLHYDSFLPKLLDYDENILAQSRCNEIYTKHNKPYKFLFLNGRERPHRRAMIQALESVLDQAIWSNLDSGNGPVHYLDAKYEFDFYQDQVGVPGTVGYVKPNLFKGEWGEIYLKAEPYIDTYFSVVTETVFDYPYSFRTEKIWKPLVMGQPWIAVANQGYLRDMHNLGFQTFGHLFDETYDLIENSQDRLTRMSQVIQDLCQQDLDAFVTAAEVVCKYNQQHYAEMRLRVRQEFPERFLQFLKQYNFDE